MLQWLGHEMRRDDENSRWSCYKLETGRTETPREAREIVTRFEKISKMFAESTIGKILSGIGQKKKKKRRQWKFL